MRAGILALPRTRSKLPMPFLRVLDPATRLAEVLFGLVMTLSFTLTASVLLAEQGRAGARELLLAIFGCNLAWGIIDAALYLLSQLVERGRKRKVLHALRAAQSTAEAQEILGAELDEILAAVLEPGERAALYRTIDARLRDLEPGPLQLTRTDWRGALESFWLVFLTGIPAALPFIFLADLFVALRVSNALLLGFLCYIGHRTARALELRRPLRFALGLLGAGLALVLLAIALGG